MDISLTEDQQLIASTALAFATDALTADRIRALETTDDQFDHATWKQMVDMGWAGAVFPAEYGGSDFSLFELALIVEALARAPFRRRCIRPWWRPAFCCSMQALRSSAATGCRVSPTAAHC